MRSKLFIISWWTMLFILNAGGQGTTGGNGAGGVTQSNDVRQRLPALSGNIKGTNAGVLGTTVWRFGAPTLRTNKFNLQLPTNLPPTVTNQPYPETNQSDRGTNQAELAQTNQPGGAAPLSLPRGTNGFVAVAPEAVIWQFGAPTSRTNKFNPLLPTNAPPPVVDKHSPEMNPPETGTNQPQSETNQLSPVSKPSPAGSSNAEPVVWQFGAPTSRTNKFSPALPTNRPAPVVDKHSPEKSPSDRGTNQSGPDTNQSSKLPKLSPPASNNAGPVWQFGTPTSRTNKFNPVLPTNLPPAVTNQK